MLLVLLRFLGFRIINSSLALLRSTRRGIFWGNTVLELGWTGTIVFTVDEFQKHISALLPGRIVILGRQTGQLSSPKFLSCIDQRRICLDSIGSTGEGFVLLMICNQILKDVLGSLVGRCFIVVVVSPFVVVLGQLPAFSSQSWLLTGIDGPGGGGIKFHITIFFVGILVLVIGPPSSIAPGSFLLVVIVATPMAAHDRCFEFAKL